MKENRFVFLNDKVVPEEQAVISAFDRGFLYGDGLFASIRICNGRPFRWRRHMLRMQRGANFLRLALPIPEPKLRELAIDLVRLNNLPESVLRLTVSRGVGGRGYSPKGVGNPSLVMSVHALPDQGSRPAEWRLATSSLTLRASDPLAFFKSCNRLMQVVARAEADAAGCDDALLLNDAGHAVETSSGNLFWIDEEQVCTAPLGTGILPGITRSVVFEVCDALGRRVQERNITPADLVKANGVFASVSSLGVVEVAAIDGTEIARNEFVTSIREAYEDVLRWETSHHPGGKSR
jgi:branched-chain amino acid aminotransferase